MPERRATSVIRARRRLDVDVRGTLGLVGLLSKWLGVAAVYPVVIALLYREPVWPFAAAGTGMFALGWVVQRWAGDTSRVGVREGFLVVALVWLVAPLFAAAPYLLSGESQLARPVDALFEGMAGFTATGATLLTDIADLDRSLLMWRQLTQWLGGMGIVVLALAVLPRLRVGGRQLLESELPGPDVDQLATRIGDAARRFGLIYIGLTAAEAVVLMAFGWSGIDDRMDPFNAVAHAMTTIATGGFSPENRSLEPFSAPTQWVVVAFMLVAGVNYALLYAALIRRRVRTLVRDEELKLYLLVVTAVAVILSAELWTEGFESGEPAIRHATFQAVSLLTTTGYATADYAAWPSLALVTIVGLMFVGASAGSTSGSVKILRHLLLGRILRRELAQTVHPELVEPIRVNGHAVDERTLRAVASYILLYVGLFAAGGLVLTLDAAYGGPIVTPFEAIGASAATLGNVGPAVGFAGPMGSYEPFGDVSTVVMTLLMWVGRLEVIPVVVLVTRRYWRV